MCFIIKCDYEVWALIFIKVQGEFGYRKSNEHHTDVLDSAAS